jgi:DNA (cytosine-5)-methyltransferase 1
MSAAKAVRPAAGSRPRLLDLFCKAGGAAMGYYRAGFDVVGVDIRPQPRYPFEFHQADALTFPLDGFDAIHASPPCQRYSSSSAANRNAQPRLFVTRGAHRAKEYPDLLGPTRERLVASGLPWVIENVPGAPMTAHVVLCGCMFDGLGVYRERWFETNPVLYGLSLMHRHAETRICVAGNGTSSWYRQKTGIKNRSVDAIRAAMGIDWMSRSELAQAIPPAYTEYIGRRLLAALEAVA